MKRGRTAAPPANVGGNTVVGKDVSQQAARGLFDPLLYSSPPHRWYNIYLSHTIDFCKLITPVIILVIMYHYNAWDNPVAWAYFGTHGSYGILWASKTYCGFGDLSFHKHGSIFGHLVTLAQLSLYWLPIYRICNGAGTQAPLPIMGIGIFLYSFGVFWHFTADIQKAEYMSIKNALRLELGDEAAQKILGNILKTKMWKWVRNPNYFGELCIYASFCVLSYDWIPFVAFGCIIAVVWSSFIRKKDKSMSRHGSEYAEYKSSTFLIIPGVL
jgi:hypothetical protein